MVTAPETHHGLRPPRHFCVTSRRSGGICHLSSWSMPCLLCFVAAVCFICSTASARLEEINAYFAAICEEDARVFGGAVVTWGENEKGIDAFTTTALGSRAVVGKRIPMTLDTSFRTNTLSEVFLVMTVAYLQDRGELPFSRTQPIPRSFLPPPYSGKVAFQNPLFPAAVVSLDTLLLHTSSLTEVGFDSGAVQTPGKTVNITKFVESVFAKALSGGLWGTGEPGLGSSYRYSRLNTALTTYILEKVLEKMAPPVSLATFIQNNFISLMGLSGTFLLDNVGNVPGPTYPKDSGVSLSARAVQDVTGDGSKVALSRTIHAAYASDYMYYTSALDLAKLAYELFLGGHHTAVGNALKNDPVNINGENLPPGAVSRSLGVYGFDPKILCRELGDTETCDFGDGANLYGWALTGAYNQIALLCTSKKCVAAEVSYFQTRSTIKPHALGLAVSSLRQVKVRPPLQGGKLYPLYVFIGVLATIIISIVGSYVADYIVQPAPAKPTFPVQNARNTPLPMNGSGTEDVSVPLREEGAYATQGISSPLRRLDMYD
ncbi:hypothetical protein C4B63_89g66 [Trypanosoma cruzi]|uniref:Uncharacterized protein n=1 Tax=Trypanosoma cruzi TaxID=5693 RepID=A0A2V2UU12_TRYCR|nr:hypothetical protein C4B63_89g66 [Trypanosoma cruzi]